MALWSSGGILDEDEDEDVELYEAPVGIRLGRMGRGESEAEFGGMVVGVMTSAQRERGWEESLRRQL